MSVDKSIRRNEKKKKRRGQVNQDDGSADKRSVFYAILLPLRPFVVILTKISLIFRESPKSQGRVNPRTLRFVKNDNYKKSEETIEKEHEQVWYVVLIILIIIYIFTL